jgi:multicomponent Na+:H+ antiporter subunit G
VALTVPHVAIAVLLGAAGLMGIVSVLGVALMKGTHNRLHYIAPVSVVGAAAVVIALVVQNLFDSRGIKALLVFVMLAGLNPILIHATARAERTRERRDERFIRSTTGREP